MIFLVVAQLLVGGSAAPTPRVTAPPPPLHPEYQYLHKYTVHDAAARGAVCNDGTPAAFYYRNCTANGDRRVGDTTDYCLKGSLNGVQERRWFVHLDAADGLFCWDADSCAGRPAKWKGSGGLPSKLFLDGWLSPYPEENPNFYKQSSVFVPSCSSDLWVGNSSGAKGASLPFAGRRIVRAVLEDLATGTFDGVEAPLRAVDTMVVGGGPGAMLLLAEVRGLLPKAAGLKAVCDGCVLPNTAALAPAVDCGNGTTVTYRDALDAGAAAWDLAPPSWCKTSLGSGLAASCLLADKLLPGLSDGEDAVDLFVEAVQYNDAFLAANGAPHWKALPQQKQYADSIATLVRQAAAAASFSFCPAVDAMEGSALLDHDLYYNTNLNCTSPGSPPFQFDLSNSLSDFITDPGATKLTCVTR